MSRRGQTAPVRTAASRMIIRRTAILRRMQSVGRIESAAPSRVRYPTNRDRSDSAARTLHRGKQEIARATPKLRIAGLIGRLPPRMANYRRFLARRRGRGGARETPWLRGGLVGGRRLGAFPRRLAAGFWVRAAIHFRANDLIPPQGAV